MSSTTLSPFRDIDDVPSDMVDGCHWKGSWSITLFQKRWLLLGIYGWPHCESRGQFS